LKNYISILLFSFFSSFCFAQSEVIKLGILPSTYGDGMPLAEFAEFEKNVIKRLEKIERYEIVRDQASFEDVNINAENGVLKIDDKLLAEKIAVKYLLQIVFGDTDWSSNTSTSPNESIAYGHSATVWMTLNIYDIATGVLENSITLTADTADGLRQKRGIRGSPNPYKNAVSNAQKGLWAKTTRALKTLLPLNLEVIKVVKEENDKAQAILINGGKFHGLQPKESVYVFYEKEYIVRGQSTMRFVEVAKISLAKVNSETSIGKVKNGQKAIINALNNGKKLKCILKDPNQYKKGYGF